MQGPFWSHTSYCILTRGRARELCASLIYTSTHLIEEASSLHLHHLTKAPPMDAITMGIRITSYEVSEGHKCWDHSRYKREPAHPPPVAVVTHTPLILISCITLQPFHTFYHSGFHKSRSVKCQLHLIFSLFNVSLFPAEAQGTYQEVQMCPFLQGSFSLPLWIFIPRARLEEGRGWQDGKFWHHWLTRCCRSPLVSRRTDLEFPLTDNCLTCGAPLWFSWTFTSWRYPTSYVLFKSGEMFWPPQLPTCSSHHSLFPPLCKHLLEKIN